MIKFFNRPSSNSAKASLFFEKTGLPYELVLVDTPMRDQYLPAFTAINLNSNTPTLVDGKAAVFGSDAILLFLDEKTSAFLPLNASALGAQIYLWLMFFATGIGLYFGQAMHFKHVVPEPKTYAVNCYGFEAHRHWALIGVQLAMYRYMLGDTKTIVDTAVRGWMRAVSSSLVAGARTTPPNVKRLLDEINTNSAARRAKDLKTKRAHTAEMDEETRKVLFPRNARIPSPAAT